MAHVENNIRIDGKPLRKGVTFTDLITTGGGINKSGVPLLLVVDGAQKIIGKPAADSFFNLVMKDESVKA